MVEVTPALAQAHRAILEWETGRRIAVDSTGAVTAGGRPLRRHRFRHNYYFMAGDNVLNSQDSRYLGVVPEEYIVGIVCAMALASAGCDGRRDGIKDTIAEMREHPVALPLDRMQCRYGGSDTVMRDSVKPVLRMVVYLDSAY